MKRLLALAIAVCLCNSLPARADDPPGSYWVLTNDAVPGRFTSANGACHAFYNDVLQRFPSPPFVVAPYQPPTSDTDPDAPGPITESCVQTITIPGTPPLVTNSSAGVRRAGGCAEGQTYNPDTGDCEDPDKDQDRKEMGDPDSDQQPGVILACPGSSSSKGQGDPINTASGNEFETETDYQDKDGELRFVRYYNSKDGAWRHTYQISLYSDASGLVVTFDDGHSSVFTLDDNGVAIAEPTEYGHMSQVSGQWVYTSPTNDRFTFDSSGRLIKWIQTNGLAQTLTYTVGVSGGATITTTKVTDSRGHLLTYVSKFNGPLTTMTVGDLSIAYTWNTATDTSTTPSATVMQLTNVASTRSGHTATRAFTYGDTRSPRWMTGITDERGIQFASFTYDAQGRATSSQHAGGADATTVTYNSDGTNTVTNALGHQVTYTYQVFQGVGRIVSIQGEPAAGCPASNSSYTYNDNGQVATKTDALGHITTYAYDTSGREITRVEAKGTDQERTITTTYNGTTLLPVTVTTPDRTTTYGYDTQNRVISTTVHANNQE